MFSDALIRITGPTPSLKKWADTHLAGECFSLESVVATPADLLFDVNNLAEDGYNALFGDWAALRLRHMFKAPAERLGVEFPCASRESVLACIENLGDAGRIMLQLGRRLKSNIDQYGFRDAADWRKVHWGVEADFSESLIEIADDAIRIAVCSLGTAAKTFALYSKPYADLAFEICSVTENGRRPQCLSIKHGKRVQNPDNDVVDPAALIWDFRRSVGARWLADCDKSTSWARQLDINERGRAVFGGTQIAVDFALRRIRNGETARELGKRFPELNDDHVRALESLAASEHRDGLKIITRTQ